jgi:hypothetical protein
VRFCSVVQFTIEYMLASKSLKILKLTNYHILIIMSDRFFLEAKYEPLINYQRKVTIGHYIIFTFICCGNRRFIMISCHLQKSPLESVLSQPISSYPDF